MPPDSQHRACALNPEIGIEELAADTADAGMGERAHQFVQPGGAEHLDVVGQEAQHVAARLPCRKVPLRRVADVLRVLEEGQPAGALADHAAHGRMKAPVVDQQDLQLRVGREHADAVDTAGQVRARARQDDDADLGRGARAAPTESGCSWWPRRSMTVASTPIRLRCSSTTRREASTTYGLAETADAVDSEWTLQW